MTWHNGLGVSKEEYDAAQNELYELAEQYYALREKEIILDAQIKEVMEKRRAIFYKMPWIDLGRKKEGTC